MGWAGASIKLTFDPPPYINRVPRYGYFEGPGQGFLSFTAEKRLAFEQGLQLVRDSLPRVSKDFVIIANYSYAGEEGGVEGWVNMAKGFAQAGVHVLEVDLGCPNMSLNRHLTGDIGLNSPKSVSRAAYEAGVAAAGSNVDRLAIPPTDIWNPKQSVCHLREEVSMSCMAGP